MAPKAPITAVVVCYNEGKLLGRCLESLQFCDELIVVDLGSSDDSVALATQLGAEVLHHPWVPIGEMARAEGVRRAKHDWILIADPDEAVSPELAADISAVIDQNPPTVGVISVPWLNHVYGRVLRGTVWGGFERRKRLLMHKDRVRLNTRVHSDYFDLKSGFGVLDIPLEEHNFLLHFWLNDFWEFFRKHGRYLTLEGEARYARGERFSWRRTMAAPVRALYESLVRLQGWRDGIAGILLSLFWAWYNLGAQLSLRRYQKSHGR